MAKEYKVKTLKNGEKRYYKDISLGNHIDGSRKRTTITASSVKNLRKKEMSLRIGNKVIINSNAILFEDAWKAHLADIKEKISVGTMQFKIYKYNKYFRIFEGMPISKIDDKKINDFILSIPTNQSQSSVSGTVSTLKTFLRWCQRNKLIESDPFIYIEAIKVEKPDLNFWTEDEFKLFIKTITNEKYKLIFTIAFYMGLRRGEIFGLSYKDFINNRVYLSHSIKMINGKQTLTDTFKTKESKRIVPVPLWLDIGNGTGLLFDIGYRSASYRFNSYVKKYNDSHDIKLKKIRFHDLRHSYASYLIHKKIDIYTVSKLMGHKKMQTTIDRYAHLYDDTYEEISAIL